MEVSQQQYNTIRVKASEIRTNNPFEEAEIIMVMLGRLIREYSRIVADHKNYVKDSKTKEDRKRAKNWHKPIIIHAKETLASLIRIEKMCLLANNPIKGYKKARECYNPEMDVFIIQKKLTRYD